MTSELVTSSHLKRKAVIYIRQSTPNQVLTNQESLRLQYALRDRALALGWQDGDIAVIDRDLGRSGASTDARAGFRDLVGQVTLGEIGLILSIEVTRLSRNCTDWYPLLDLCGYTGCLIADRDGIYDPGTPNGRLLLGLKGTISEMELYTIRSRLQAGLLNKAKRGELAMSLPVGLTRDPIGRVILTADSEAQARLRLVFSAFLERRSVGKVVRLFCAEGLTLPRRADCTGILWKAPTEAAVLQVLKNPAYAGAFVYGRHRVSRRLTASGRPAIEAVPRAEWKIMIKDIYPAYITWETFEKIEAILTDNHARYSEKPNRGIPRDGSALLHGIAWCGKCGRKMFVVYHQRTQYFCSNLKRMPGMPRCQTVLTDPVDAAVTEAFFAAVAPAELEAWEQAQSAARQAEDALRRAATQQVERLRYQVTLAERQYNGVDPDNRLVAGELEHRWEVALRALREAEQALAVRAAPLAADDQKIVALRRNFALVARRLPDLWQDARLKNAQKKALLRCLIDKVVLDRMSPELTVARIIWQGGEDTTLHIDTSAVALRGLSDPEAMARRVAELARADTDLTDQEIAAILTSEGFRSPSQQDHVIPSTVKVFRQNQRILRRTERNPYTRAKSGWITVAKIAQNIKVSPSCIYKYIYSGSISVLFDPVRKLYLFPDTPETISLFERFRAKELPSLDFTDNSRK